MHPLTCSYQGNIELFDLVCHLLQLAPYLTRICFQSSTMTASEHPIQDQIPREAAERKVHDDILVTRPVQVNLIASHQSAAAQRPLS